MPDGTVTRPPTDPAGPRTASRHDRPALIAFVTDAASERALTEGLSDVLIDKPDIRRGGIRAAIATMQKAATPRVLAVDISGESHPLAALAELSAVVEPAAKVVVIGEIDSVDFYREITRGLGADEYLSKPLAREKIVRYLGTMVAGNPSAAENLLGARLVLVTGVHGGVGATTVAVNLAAHFGISMRRHTIVLDPDLHSGEVAFLLNVKPGPGLRMALEAPDRIDALLAERAAQPVAERLAVLAGEEDLAMELKYVPGAIASLLVALRQRYNFIVADVPIIRAPIYDELLEQAHQPVFVLSPTLASVRATLRLLALPARSKTAHRPVLVLNRLGSPGGLNRRQMEDALALKLDVVVPDLPREVIAAATMGVFAIKDSRGFRAGMAHLAKRVASAELVGGATHGAPISPDASRGFLSLFRRKT